MATSPGMGFGPGGDGHVRFALIENEQRVAQAIRSLRKALPSSASSCALSMSATGAGG